MILYTQLQQEDFTALKVKYSGVTTITAEKLTVWIKIAVEMGLNKKKKDIFRHCREIYIKKMEGYRSCMQHIE